ncbi:unnamed protein product [Linum trigynum]|uniref:Uncharacterized protein n=1 Tax=Linum trigynum TaxID=586398 RepID=A0AAV2DTQ6_9ROSI
MAFILPSRLAEVTAKEKASPCPATNSWVTVRLAKEETVASKLQIFVERTTIIVVAATQSPPPAPATIVIAQTSKVMFVSIDIQFERATDETHAAAKGQPSETARVFPVVGNLNMVLKPSEP